MDKENSSDNGPKKEKFAYFKPSEILFVISHPTDQIPSEAEIDALLEERNDGGLLGWSNRKKENEEYTIKRFKDRELHFPGTTGLPEPPYPNIDKQTVSRYQAPKPAQHTAFSLIPIEVRVAPDKENNPEGLVDTPEMAELIVRLDDLRIDLEETLNYGREEDQWVKVKVISPNWLSTPAMSEYGGGGGPGSRPVPYAGKQIDAPWEFHLPKEIDPLWPDEEDRRGEGVKVAILDTAPCLHDIVEAYEIYQKVRPERHAQQRRDVGSHKIIETLLKPGGPLHLHPASLEDLYRMRAVHLRDHDYIMTDHGLFIAGIVHSIARAAEIHLYEVLNPQGAGDLESIAKGLWKVAMEQYWAVLERKEYPKLVVSCSFMLWIPRDGDFENPDKPKVVRLSASQHPILGHRLTDLDQAIVDIIGKDEGEDEEDRLVVRSAAVIMWICDLLHYLGSKVIAAAGNDWDTDDDGRPETRYPAAFERVLGIGALPKEKLKTNSGKRKPSSFSNLADEPGSIGVATLGGEPGHGNGVLGIYLGKFPPGQSAAPGNAPDFVNENHWAWWAGTSFATPITSGAVAAVMSGPKNPQTTETAIALMYENGVIVDNQTDYEEDLLDVSQGQKKTTENP